MPDMIHMMKVLSELLKQLFSAGGEVSFLRKSQSINRGCVVLFMNKVWTRLFLMFLISIGFSANAQQHTHGQGQLLISQEGNEWHMQLILPAADTLGFEHVPETKAQKSKYETLAKKLQRNAAVIEVDGQCALIKAAHTLVNQDGDERHKNHKHNNEQNHHDVEVEYQFKCKAAITRVYVKIFETMPSLHAIELQWLLENSQGMYTLTRNQPYIEW
ncbi:DUF2796 domain-containing protein [uncultured Paraglaciecola sp.]|uniref:ZrgA family zinc uptake protein n=1 Tax=uncultured Paraglaciecola sp. TaxID=1765024 RepID=UPI0030DDB653|tara:strand:+ start:50319 stop:50966 length:648 start_codon:yes stop_codon:yes gene_type:complete